MENEKLLQMMKKRMGELDKETKDLWSKEDYIAKCRFAYNVLKSIIIEYKKGEK